MLRRIESEGKGVRTFTEKVAATPIVGVSGVHALQGGTAPARSVAASGSVAGHLMVDVVRED